MIKENKRFFNWDLKHPSLIFYGLDAKSINYNGTNSEKGLRCTTEQFLVFKIQYWAGSLILTVKKKKKNIAAHWCMHVGPLIYIFSYSFIIKSWNMEYRESQ